MIFEFDILQTLAIAVFVLFIGMFIKSKVNVLERFYIPNPVIGGVIVSVIVLIGYSTSAFILKFDTTLQTIFMTAFFTAVGFSCDFKAFIQGGKLGYKLTIVIILLIILQAIVGISLAELFNLNPLIGLSTGPVALIGGHGTSAAFGSVFEELGVFGATTVALSSATFGLVMGGVLGGPVSHYLIKKHKLLSDQDEKKTITVNNDLLEETKSESVMSADKTLSEKKLVKATYQIIIAMGLGTIISIFLQELGLIFPSYLGGLLMGLIIRNLGDYTNKFSIPMREINVIGEISLSFFIAMALMSLKLWELKELAIPMLVILIAQVVLIVLFIVFVAFRILGKDYDAAVISSGVTGFGMGAMPVAVANMQTLMSKRAASASVFLVVTAVGSLAIDISNSFIITFFMNIFS